MAPRDGAMMPDGPPRGTGIAHLGSPEVVGSQKPRGLVKARRQLVTTPLVVLSLRVVPQFPNLGMFCFTFLAFDLQKFVKQSLLPVLLLLLLGFKIFAAFLEFRDQPVSLSCSVFRGKSSNFLLLFCGPFLIFCPLGILG